MNRDDCSTDVVECEYVCTFDLLNILHFAILRCLYPKKIHVEPERNKQLFRCTIMR